MPGWMDAVDSWARAMSITNTGAPLGSECECGQCVKKMFSKAPSYPTPQVYGPKTTPTDAYSISSTCFLLQLSCI